MRTINGAKLKQMFISGSNNLYNHYPEVDSLNVFPIPDGDTGINMNLTLANGIKMIENETTTNISVIAKQFAYGLFNGGRGNSGTITSQIFTGFSKGLKEKDQIDALGLAEAFTEGKNYAYRVVKNPVEGTILTVIREASEKLSNSVSSSMSIEQGFEIIVNEARESLKRTPNLLPVLKEVGVVDSGGAGLCYILEGMRSALLNKPVKRKDASELSAASGEAQVIAEDHDVEFGYCTEFILRLGGTAQGEKRAFILDRFTQFLESHGNSLVVIQNEDLVKVHVHTLKPGVIFNYAQTYGEFTKMKCENMTEQHHEILLTEAGKDEKSKSAAAKVNHSSATTSISGTPAPVKEEEFAIIATSNGEGIDKYFNDSGVKYIVNGGQTMNPSTGDFVELIRKINAKHIFILPNNSNIILSANQAKDSLKGECDITVIETKTIPQGIAAAINFNNVLSKEENIESMSEALGQIKSGSVTYASKDSVFNDIKIKEKDFLAIKESKEIVGSFKHKVDAFKKIVESLVDEDSSVIIIFVGKDVSRREKSAIENFLSKTYPDLDIDLRIGNQPVYSFLIGVE